MKQQVLKIKQIKIDPELYPRNKYSWYIANDYKNSMQSGAIFPPIVVALLDEKYYLVDGRHRIEATKLLKQEHIQGVVHQGLTKKDIFVMSVKANISHGYTLSMQDKVLVIDKLEKFNLKSSEISSLINMPIEKIEKFKVERITNTVSGETIYLKATTKNFAGIEVPDDFNKNQTNYSTRGQIALLSQTISLIENEMLDLNNQNIIGLIMRLKPIIRSLKVSVMAKH